MKYDYMNKAVDELCHAMENNPDRFSVGIHTMVDCKTGIEYWTSNRGCIREMWVGRDTTVVFSDAQGIRLWESYEKMRATVANAAQQRIINGMVEKEDSKDSPEIGLVFALILLALGFGIFGLLTR